MFAVDFDKEFAPKLGIREKGFRKVFELLDANRHKTGQLAIVETGCIRMLDNWAGDGYSSFLFATFAQEHHATFISIDADSSHCALAREVCPAGSFLCGDSVRTLYNLRKSIPKIDLLYLDSFDVDWGNPHPSALHHLHELCAAAPMLLRGSIVCIDDNAPATGKGMYVRQYMKNIHAEQVLEDYQIAFLMP